MDLDVGESGLLGKNTGSAASASGHLRTPIVRPRGPTPTFRLLDDMAGFLREDHRQGGPPLSRPIPLTRSPGKACRQPTTCRYFQDQVHVQLQQTTHGPLYYVKSVRFGSFGARKTRGAGSNLTARILRWTPYVLWTVDLRGPETLRDAHDKSRTSLIIHAMFQVFRHISACFSS